MTENAQLVYGGVTFPLPPGGSASGPLRYTDPAIFYALEFFQSVITTYAGGAFLYEVGQIGMSAVIPAIVAGTAPYDPTEHLLKEQMPMPLLAVFRVGGRNDYRSTVKSHEDTEWAVTYSLPPLSAAQSERLEPFLHAIELLLQNRVEVGWDPAYTPTGGASGQQAWKLAGIESIHLTGVQYAPMKGMGELWLPSILLTASVKERNNQSGANLGAVPFAGADIDEQVVPQIQEDPSGLGTLDHLIDIKTDVKPPKPGP